MKWKIKVVSLFVTVFVSALNLISAERNYKFDGPIPRDVLENYLSRAITMQELCVGVGNVDDNIRMITNIGAKFIGRSMFMWGGEQRIAKPEFLAKGKEIAEKLHRADPDTMLQGCVFEFISEAVTNVPVPDWVFKDFSLEPVKRNFIYTNMLFTNITMRLGNGFVPDITRLETKMWFFFLAASYIDIGMEAIHFGQIELVGKTDKGYKNWQELIQRVRNYAAKNARRHWVVCDAHTPSGGIVVDGKLLLDFHSFPLRPREVANSQQKAILEMGYLDSIYGRSKGGIAPAGWKCEHLPYLVEFDNWGASKSGGQASQSPKPSHWVWGYDEISWFARQPESYRNEWLWYVWDWVRKNDPNGYVQFCCSRVLHDPVITPDGKKIYWYFANMKSPACPDGFSQEETIKAIWQKGN